MNRANKKKKKLANQKLLANAGIQYRVNPKCPWHYHIGYGNDRIDFWLSTGKYFVLSTGKYHTGIAGMIEMIKKKSVIKKSKVIPAKPSFNYQPSKASTDARHRQRKIMAHFGMDFSQ